MNDRNKSVAVLGFVKVEIRKVEEFIVTFIEQIHRVWYNNIDWKFLNENKK